MAKAYSYIRFSSAKQAQGSSLERQQENLSRFLAENPQYELAETRFEDLGISGWSGEHLGHGLGKLQAAVNAGIIEAGDIIVIEAIDRISRLPLEDAVSLTSGILNKGVAIHTVEDRTTYDKTTYRQGHTALALILKTFASWEYSERLSERVKASYSKRAEAVRKGETIRRKNACWHTSDGKVVEEVAVHIRWMFEEYIAGAGVRKLAGEMMGRHPAFARVNPSHIRRWLRDKSLIGTWAKRDGEEVPGAFEPVLTPAVFYQAQALMNPQKDYTHPAKNFLTGLVKCQECGGNFAVKSQGTGNPFMGCYARTYHRCTNGTSIPLLVLHRVVMEEALDYIEDGIRASRLGEHDKHRLVVQGKLEEVQRGINGLSEAIAAHGFMPELNAKLAELKVTRTSLEAELARIPQKGDKEPVTNRELMAVWNGDKLKLNAMLQRAGFAVWCTGRKMKIGADGPEYEYLRYARRAKDFIVKTPVGEWELDGSQGNYHD